MAVVIQPGTMNRIDISRLNRSHHLTRLATYASFVRFSHSVFALPFALTGALLALQSHRRRGTRRRWGGG